MPDTDSSNVIMGDENFPVMRSKNSENSPRRGWTCPDDQTIAAYLDNALGRTKKARVESHMSNCKRCRLIVADVVRLQREAELPVPPFELARKPVQFVPAVSSFRWIWAPAAVALILLITVT